MRRSAWSWLAGFAAPALGLVFGTVLVLTSPNQAAPLWLLWAPLAIALSTAAGAVFTYGRRRWAELCVLHRVRVREVAAPVVAIEIGGIATVNSTLFLHGAAHEDWRGGLLVTLVLLLAAPAAGVMYGVRHAAGSESLSHALAGQVSLLVALRRLLERLLVAVGALVALTTLESAAALSLARSVHSLGTRPPQYVLVIGGVGSLLVALVYVPAWAALRDRGLRLCDELLPMACPDEPSAILSRAGDRQTLEQILGTNRNVLADLQTGLAILGPLLASAAAAFLPH
jgi:hypothetical protein